MTVGLRRTRACLGATALLWAGLAPAASWTVGSASGASGDEVTVALRFQSAGVAVGADVSLSFDQARLTVDAPAGELAGAAREGRCGWNGSNQLSALMFSPSSAPLPNQNVLACEFTLRIRPTTPAGGTVIRANRANCATNTGQSTTCTVATGTVTVTDGPAPAWSAPPAPSTDLVFRLAPSAPTVEELLQGGVERSPIDAFRNSRALRIRPLLDDRGDRAHIARLARLPDSPEARLHRYMVIEFATPEDRDETLRAIERDARFEVAGASTVMDLTSKGDEPSLAKAAVSQPHRDDLDFDGLWSRAGGWGLVGMVDTGITADHADLRSFSGTNSVGGTWVNGGNYLPYFSYNHGGKGQATNLLIETQTSTADAADGTLCGTTLPQPFVGHGTHVAGLIGANASDNAGVTGACRNCGVAVRKSTNSLCVGGVVRFGNLTTNVVAGVHGLIGAGAQVINGSFANEDTWCGAYGAADTDAFCDEIELAEKRDVVIVAAAGNNLKRLGFPASHPKVTAVGGIIEINEAGLPVYWDYRPNCPVFTPVALTNTECGSNFRNGSPQIDFEDEPYWNYIELVAPATSLQSTMVYNRTWNEFILCGDEFDGSIDGFGPCTGTSMSAPQVSALVGVLRSINPLMRAGTPWTQPAGSGIRGLLRATSSRTIAGQLNDPKLGFGVPNGLLAANRMLGQVGSEQAHNRVTPLFNLYSTGRDDYAAVATPQLAMGLSLAPTSAYRGVRQGTDTFIQGVTIPGYAAFPDTDAGAPRALAMVLTTEHSRAGLPTPAPLFLMAKAAATSTHQDHVLVNSGMVQTLANAGYAYAGRQGFVYPWCSTTNCNPPGTQKLHLKCKNATNATARRCATFLESQRSQFEPLGFTVKFPGTDRTELGFAYPVTDVDSDGLVDAAEYVIGTSTALADSDGDGVSDANEYPLANLPVSDPCQGPNIQCPHILNRIFKDSFE